MHKQLLYKLENNSKNLEIWASINHSGNLIIEGHDLSADLPKMFGPDITEYEWTNTIKKKDFTKLRKILNGKDSDNILKIFVKRFSGDKAMEISAFIKDNDIQHKFWNRMGD